MDKMIEDPPTMFDLSVDVLLVLLEAGKLLLNKQLLTINALNSIDRTRILHFLMRFELVDALVRTFPDPPGKIPSRVASVLCKLAQSGQNIILNMAVPPSDFIL